MREAKALRRLAELNRVGEGWYIARRTTAVTIAAESAVMLWGVGRVVAGQATWQSLRAGVPFGAFFFVGIVSVVVGAMTAMREVARLREQFGEEEEEPLP